MAQGWFERVLLCFASEVIAACTEIPRADNRTRRDFPLKIEIVLNRVWELRVVRCRENVDRLREHSILRVEEAGEHK